MCGRFTQKSERKLIELEFYIRNFFSDIVTSYNLAPGQDAGFYLLRYEPDSRNLACTFAKLRMSGSPAKHLEKLKEGRGTTVINPIDKLFVIKIEQIYRHLTSNHPYISFLTKIP